MPEDNKWNALINRVEAESKNTLANNTSDGLCIVAVNILVNSQGVPLLWTVSPGRRIEPSRQAKQVMTELVRNLTPD